ncbi:MAG: sulfite exporter TauE/SafE family protein [Archaeoglobaceae archaeon]
MEYIMWMALLFVFAFIIGIIAPVSGVGGGVLFVPLTTAFFPFNIDFVRGAGLTLALTSALSSSPRLIERGLANLRVAIVIATVSIASSIAGSVLGLWITNELPEGKHYITIALGITLLFIFVVMVKSKRVEFPEVTEVDPISKKLDLAGKWYEPSRSEVVEYRLTRLPYSLPAFAGVGLIAGMFGLGAGWANVPVLNLLMGAPLRIAVSTSMLIIALNDAAAMWVYIAKGAVLPLIVVPSVFGVFIGARIGAMIAERVRPRIIRLVVLGIMLLAALLDIEKGLTGLGVM